MQRNYNRKLRIGTKQTDGSVVCEDGAKSHVVATVVSKKKAARRMLIFYVSVDTQEKFAFICVKYLVDFKKSKKDYQITRFWLAVDL